MPPFFGVAIVYDAMRRVVPTFEAHLENENLLERQRRRFDRGEPPTDASSTESEDIDIHGPRPPKPPLPQEFLRIMEPPLTKSERGGLASTAHWHRPGACCKREWDLEEAQLRHFLAADKHWMFESNTGALLKGVIVHHNIKCRWQKLGIWNSEWGIPSRFESQLNDCIWNWKVTRPPTNNL